LSERLVAGSEAAESPAEGPEAKLLEQEVKVSCTLGLLLCLDRPHRLAFIVGDVLGLPGDEAAEVSGVPAATFRKRLSRARERLRGFLAEGCGIVNAEAPCRCSRQVGPALAAGKIAPDRLLFARHPRRPLDARALLSKARELEDLHASVQLYRSLPDFEAPASVAQAVRDLLALRPPSLLLD
ncbi:MAG TPA: sigma factor-like helix-turn-helix DNA-binding protein, partial [Polyangiaceae bacterium]|nr:sigma factor-like helix-turn-helix DNA-binding protein [Polyangiaceae bacterium]